jgi:uncharacterized membrane protein
MKRLRDDEGSILPLTIFYGFLSLVLILLVVAATSLYLERKRLFTLADGAALVGAEAFDLDAATLTTLANPANPVIQSADGGQPKLQSADVAAAVRDYLSATRTDGFEALTLVSARSIDGRSATVELSTYWRPPMLSLLVPEGLRIQVVSVGRSVFF